MRAPLSAAAAQQEHPVQAVSGEQANGAGNLHRVLQVVDLRLDPPIGEAKEVCLLAGDEVSPLVDAPDVHAAIGREDGDFEYVGQFATPP
jgi:hypothetical protein